MAESPVARTLVLAAETLGGVANLAAKLGFSVEEVERWVAGIPPPPGTEVFVAALDIVARGKAQ